LGKNSREWTPLQQEITLLKDYLELEQLRFGFSFTVHINEFIDPASVEVPTLLLQPLVENAIKHGISAIRDKGAVEILVDKNKSDMVISIRDNGKGGIKITPEGQGMQLTIDRLQLLKEINPAQIIELDNSGSSTVILTFKNWLAE
jgi:two-component system, LytTR family, sensor kinase